MWPCGPVCLCPVLLPCLLPNHPCLTCRLFVTLYRTSGLPFRSPSGLSCIVLTVPLSVLSSTDHRCTSVPWPFRTISMTWYHVLVCSYCTAMPYNNMYVAFGRCIPNAARAAARASSHEFFSNKTSNSFNFSACSIRVLGKSQPRCW